jgi:UDP-N-acetylmuramate dehydrogenase
MASSRAVQERADIPLSELTTLRLGGPARRLVEAGSDEEVLKALSAADGSTLVVAGGSNLVIADAGFDGTVIRIGSRGISVERRGERLRVAVAAGEPWDAVVARCVEEGLAGVECLSGIPGSTGATPIQNVGAYGQEVSSTISSVRAYDRHRGATVELTPAECGFSYRASAFKHSDRHIVLGVTFVLEPSPHAVPVRYAELARTLGVELGDHPPLGEVREAVLALRRGKGMVIDPGDPDSVSAGSFFVNPILTAQEFDDLAARSAERPPSWPEPDGRVKTSAAWLIEQAGFHRGYGNGHVGVSTKHTLALINRGGGSTAELLALARELRDGVRQRFGITLQPEPTLVGVKL